MNHFGQVGIPSVLARTLLWILIAATSSGAQAPDRVTHGSPRQSAEEDGPFFYRGLPYGSEASFGPLAVLTNKGFDLSQLENRDRRVFRYAYSIDHLSDALVHPAAAVRRGGGWWHFVRGEILPLTFDQRGSKWIPNYFGHTLTGGILSRQLGEWLEVRRVPAPMLSGAVLTMAAALLNEAYEHAGLSVGSSATVADIFIFDLGGVILFANDGVARFFSRRLHATVWPGQASTILNSGELANAGTHLVFKIPWHIVPRSSLFLRTGLAGQLGLTTHFREGLDLSVAAGVEARAIRFDAVTGDEWVDFTVTSGAYLDRNGSLLGSAVVSGVPHRWLAINVYPGVFPILGGAVGGWLVVSRDWRLSVGLGTRITWGAGMGLSW